MDMDVLRRRLSCEEINAMALFHYEGPVQVIRTLEDWKNALPDLRSADLLGFDTETRPSFRKGRRNFPALIQLATANAVYLVQLAFLPFGPHVVEVLANPDQVKSGVGIRDDMRDLARLHDFEPAGLVDLGGVAQIAQSGFAHLGGQFFWLAYFQRFPVFQLEPHGTDPASDCLRRHRCLDRAADFFAHVRNGAHSLLSQRLRGRAVQ